MKLLITTAFVATGLLLGGCSKLLDPEWMSYSDCHNACGPLGVEVYQPQGGYPFSYSSICKCKAGK